MTRSEAERITIEVFNFQGNPVKAAIDIRWLEKLGLLKFDEEIVIDIPNSIKKIMTLNQIENLAILMVKEGWEFKQKGKTT